MDFLEQLLANQFLTGGFLLGSLGCVVAMIRKWPSMAWNRLKALFVIEIDIPGHDQAFRWLNFWLSQQLYSRKHARLLTVTTSAPSGEPESCEKRPKIIFSPAPGNHVLRFRGCWILLSRARKELEGKESWSAPRESFNVKFFTRDRAVAEGLLLEARELVYPKDDDRITILNARWDNWNSTTRRRPRSLESVILKSGLLEEMLVEITQFRKSEAWYNERGIPWRLGILLAGSPGSGKSSTVVAIASHFGLDIAILNLSLKALDDDSLCSYLADVPKNAIVLLEDIDCVFVQREATDDKNNHVTFSGLLNAIDGVAASEGRILFMTTNHPEKLDPALIRPGRVDLRFAIDSPDRDQVIRLFLRFYPGADPSKLKNLPNMSMAAWQGHFLKHRRSAEDAISNPIS